ncbi:MAG: hypothetical protein IPK39_24200 [Sulfuritalea sp.]|nr:hypothetical protein [Sulfuritalea sp.]
MLDRRSLRFYDPMVRPGQQLRAGYQCSFVIRQGAMQTPLTDKYQLTARLVRADDAGQHLVGKGQTLSRMSARLLGEYPRHPLPDVEAGFNIEGEILLNPAPDFGRHMPGVAACIHFNYIQPVALDVAHHVDAKHRNIRKRAMRAPCQIGQIRFIDQGKNTAFAG